MNRHIPLNAMALAGTPRIARWASRLALLMITGTPIALALVPWQQNVHGFGRAIAFNPVYRTQFVVSPIEGRVKKWNVYEGKRVKTGDRIAELIDNDPQLELRLEQERQALVDRRQAAESRIQQIEVAVSNLEASFAIQKSFQLALVQIEQEQLNRARQDLVDAEFGLRAAHENEQRMEGLLKSGGSSQRDVELAVRDRGQAKAKLDSAEANINLRDKAVKAAQDLLERIDKDRATAVSRENAVKDSAKAELAAAEAALLQIDTRIARQRAQYIESPCDGVVYRLLANAEMGGMLVRPGERLAMIVPDIKPVLPDSDSDGKAPPGIVAELFIDGNDLPLVRVGDRARLQFEGWPAVQFVAMPEAAAGTFGGRVRLVDPAANERGQFRILVEPDPNDLPWPNEDYLRQGVQVQGWVLLDAAENNVTLGWELWRLLNGFPVTRSVEAKSRGSLLGPVR